jgi:hypothetical protein
MLNACDVCQLPAVMRVFDNAHYSSGIDEDEKHEVVANPYVVPAPRPRDPHGLFSPRPVRVWRNHVDVGPREGSVVCQFDHRITGCDGPSQFGRYFWLDRRTSIPPIHNCKREPDGDYTQSDGDSRTSHLMCMPWRCLLQRAALDPHRSGISRSGPREGSAPRAIASLRESGRSVLRK